MIVRNVIYESETSSVENESETASMSSVDKFASNLSEIIKCLDSLEILFAERAKSLAHSSAALSLENKSKFLNENMKIFTKYKEFVTRMKSRDDLLKSLESDILSPTNRTLINSFRNSSMFLSKSLFSNTFDFICIVLV